MFKNRIRHRIAYVNITDLFQSIHLCINPQVVNAIHCDLHTLAQIQHLLITSYPSVKFRYTNKFVTDVFNRDDQLEILHNEHNRAHRSVKENLNQILEDYYFPNMRKLLKEIVSSCKICQEAKYERHPKKQHIGETPVPSYVGEILHIDIYNTDKKYFLTCVDKFSKFAISKPICSRAIVDIKPALLEILNLFKDTRIIVCDNEKSLNSQTIKSLVKNNFGADIYATPPLHSSSNGQVERFHSTLTEIARCLKLENISTESTDLVLLATSRYNRSIHSTTKHRPIDIIQSLPENLRNEISNKILVKQKSDLNFHNKNKSSKTFKPGEKVYMKTNKRLGNKFSKPYVEKIVQEDLGTTLKIDDRIVHKDNVKFLS